MLVSHKIIREIAISYLFFIEYCLYNLICDYDFCHIVPTAFTHAPLIATPCHEMRIRGNEPRPTLLGPYDVFLLFFFFAKLVGGYVYLEIWRTFKSQSTCYTPWVEDRVYNFNRLILLNFD
jgi:hypothetical protein